MSRKSFEELTTQARATGRCIACDGPTKLFAHGMHYAVRCKNPECVKTYAALHHEFVRREWREHLKGFKKVTTPPTEALRGL